MLPLTAAHLWESRQRKVLLKCWIVPEVLEVECLLRGSELLGCLARLRLGLKVGIELLLLWWWLGLSLLLLLLLLLLIISEVQQRISELGRIEECVNAIDERLEERT